MKKILRCTAVAMIFSLMSAFIPDVPETAAVDSETKLIALTFDDGPNTTTTNEVLDILEEYNAKASFFLIGNNINDKSAETVKRAYSMGCEIDNHSKSHPNMGSMSADDIKYEVDYVDEKVVEIIGEKTKFFRPPFIDVSQTMYDTIDIPFICGIDCQDYMENVTAQERADYILNGAKDGIIVLLHDAAGNTQTVEALKIVMPELVGQGYEFVTLTELFERQGETPKDNTIYTQVAKYPCGNYSAYSSVFNGEVEGDTSWSGWSDTAVLDAEELKKLGDSYAIEVEYNCSNPPVIALQKWSGTPIWQSIQPFYSNGEKACFLAEDIISVLESLEVDYTDLDRIAVRPFMNNMKMYSVNILVKNSGNSETVKSDVNADGVFSVADLVSMQKFLLDGTALADWKAGDLDGNNKTDIFDLVIMRKEIIRVSIK